MMTCTIEFRRLIHDVTNPEFDKRCRYGTESTETFAKGFAFVVQTRRYTRELASGEVRDEIQRNAVGAGCRANDPMNIASWGRSSKRAALFDVLVASSEPSAPQSAKEGLLLVDLTESHAMEVLEKLLARGAVSMDAIVEAARAYTSEDGQ